MEHHLLLSLFPNVIIIIGLISVIVKDAIRKPLFSNVIFLGLFSAVVYTEREGSFCLTLNKLIKYEKHAVFVLNQIPTS